MRYHLIQLKLCDIEKNYYDIAKKQQYGECLENFLSFRHQAWISITNGARIGKTLKKMARFNLSIQEQLPITKSLLVSCNIVIEFLGILRLYFLQVFKNE